MSWQRDVTIILRQEPELWLDYLTGRRLAGDLPGPKPKLFRLPTFALNTLWFLLWAVTKYSWHGTVARDRPGGVRFVVLATSRNQINTTSGIIRALAATRHPVLGLSKKKRLNSAADQSLYAPITYSAKDIARALGAYRRHGHALFRKLRNAFGEPGTNQFLEVAKVYLYLAYFYRILGESRPDAVVTSNDHSALNRCMLSVAHRLGIKTAYVQHASVSPHFPALLFDYAFLDGPAAAEVYARCSGNRPDTLERSVTATVIYSGQQKRLTRKSAKRQDAVGIAINKMDDISSVLRVVQALAERGVPLIIRWHPRQSSGDIQKIERHSFKRPGLAVSHPEKETVDGFLDRVGWLVAGNSSIHLEAAIKGVTPLYYEFSETPTPDYYGFVQKGLATSVTSEGELVRLLTSGKAPELNDAAVRFYSSTFGTEWEGRENELVASHLCKLIERDLP